MDHYGPIIAYGRLSRTEVDLLFSAKSLGSVKLTIGNQVDPALVDFTSSGRFLNSIGSVCEVLSSKSVRLVVCVESVELQSDSVLQALLSGIFLNKLL